MPRILITGAGGPAAICYLQSVTRDAAVELHCADMDPLAAGLYLVPAERRHLIPAGRSEALVPTLLALCARHEIDLLVPTVDVELLAVARARAAFEAQGVRLLLAPAEALERCLDKWELYLHCLGPIPLPHTAVLDGNFKARTWPGGWPAIAKPRSGSGSRGIRRIDGPAGLRGLPRDGSLLLQELLPGAEYSVDVLCDAPGETVAAVPRERLKVDSGVAVAARTVADPELVALAAAVARQLGLTGVANVQLRRDRAGLPRLLEVNPRFPGTMALTVAAGVDMPRLATAAALGEPLPPCDGSFEEVAMVRTLANHVVDCDAFASLAPSSAQVA